MQGFETFKFAGPLVAGQTREFDVYVKGKGRPILLLQELPGIADETVGLVNRLNDAGFRVYLPHMLGKLGKRQVTLNSLKLIFCLRREFHSFSQFKLSPIANWMRDLCRHIRARECASGVGVIGMCLTGNFAMALMADDAVIAGVACQPSLPAKKTVGLHMSPKETADARQGMKDKGGALVMSYDADELCPMTRIKEIESTFKPFIEIKTFKGENHSTLTGDYGDGVRDDAFEHARSYLDRQFASVEGKATGQTR